MSSDKKKFIIKPFKTKAQMDAPAARQVWEALRNAINEIHNKNASALSFEELYRNAYNLVLHKHGELLYSGVRDSVKAQLEATAAEIAASPDDQLLRELSIRWQDHQLTMVMVRDILMYMDRTYVNQQKKTPIYKMGLQIFRDTIARHEKVQGRLKNLLLLNIANERAGQLIDRGLMKTTLNMLVELGVTGTSVYEEDFEQVFLETSKQFYRAESQEYISCNTCPDYMRKAEARLNEESARARSYLNSSTEPKLNSIIEMELIANHAKVLVEMDNSGCVPMLKDDKLEDLGRMYSLFSRVPHTLNDLRGAICDFVKKTGRELVADQEGSPEPVVFVQGLLDLRGKYDRICSEALQGEKKTQKRLKEAFEDFINSDSRCASYLAQYIDELLKSGLRGVGEADAEQQLEKVIVIFRYLQDKDVFENFYKMHLSKRLLSGRSVSDESERNMIAKLKAECGYQFTSKLEGMFTDMHISKDIMDLYKKSEQCTLASSIKPSIELGVAMLTAGYWPTQSVPMCKLPSQVLNACEGFAGFYLKKHTGRKITWQTHMGSADLKANFSGRRHELSVSTYQMCILMLFNDTGDSSLSLAQIKDTTRIPVRELKRHLISLCTPRHRILRKSSRGKVNARGQASKHVEFSFNTEFTSKLKRVRVPLVSMKETSGAQGAEALPASVEEDRRHLIEAAIVRIMKTRKTLRHNELIAEVTRQLSIRFSPSPQVIKKRIESLIEREYLERGEDRRVYHYLA
ncbi:unnamed protein product [Chrysoparadoxa australica]